MEQQQKVSLEQIYLVLKKLETKMQKMDQYLEDLEFARRTEEAWQEIDAGKYTQYGPPKEFLATLKKKNAKNK